MNTPTPFYAADDFSGEPCVYAKDYDALRAKLSALLTAINAYECASYALTSAPLHACADAELAFHDAEHAMLELARSIGNEIH